MVKRLENTIHLKLNDSKAGKRIFHPLFDGEEDDGVGEDGKGVVCRWGGGGLRTCSPDIVEISTTVV